MRALASVSPKILIAGALLLAVGAVYAGMIGTVAVEQADWITWYSAESSYIAKWPPGIEIRHHFRFRYPPDYNFSVSTLARDYVSTFRTFLTIGLLPPDARVEPGGGTLQFPTMISMAVHADLRGESPRQWLQESLEGAAGAWVAISSVSPLRCEPGTFAGFSGLGCSYEMEIDGDGGKFRRNIDVTLINGPYPIEVAVAYRDPNHPIRRVYERVVSSIEFE